MMEFLGRYVEMMGDMEFALYTGIFVFSTVLLFGLIGKLAGTKKETGPVVKEKNSKPAPSPEKPIETKTANVAETFLASAEKKADPVSLINPKPVESDGKKDGVSGPTKTAEGIKKDAGAPTVAAPAVNPLEGAMMWDGDSGKKKKGKNIPPPPAAPARVLPPGYVDPKASATKEKESEKTVVLVAGKDTPGLAKAPDGKTAPADGVVSPTTASTVVAPARVETATAPAEPVKPAILASPKSDNTLVAKAAGAEGASDEADAKPGVDFHMYETLVRRIAGLESEVKKDPLYLDPLMRRVGVSERKLEELAEKVKTGGSIGSPTGPAAPVSAGLEAEVKVLREKVDRLQKLLEQLAEGPAGGDVS